MRALVPWLTLLLLLFGADIAAMQPPIGRPSRIALLEGSPDVTLRSVHTTVHCTALDDCTFETRYLVASDSERVVTIVADGHRIAGLELTVDGAGVLGSNVIRENDGDRELPAVTRTTRRYEVRLVAGEATIVLRGALRPRGTEDTMGVAVSLPIRHPLLGKDPGWQRRNFLVDLSTLSTWGGAARPTLELDMPAHLDVRASPKEGAIEAGVSQVSVWAAERPTHIVHGGPYVAVGGIIDDPGGWFGRVGYEVGLGLWTVIGLAVDSDFSSRVVVSPTVHGASAGFSCIFPSFGLGLGPAVRLGSQTTVGARGLLEMQLPFIGLVGNLDWYPGLDSPERFDFALLGRLSF